MKAFNSRGILILTILALTSAIHSIQVPNLGCSSPITPISMKSNPAKVFKIDLDLSIEDRLKEIHSFYGKKAKPILNKIVKIVQKKLGGPFQMFLLEQAAKAFLYSRAKPYLFDEIHSYAESTGISPHLISLLNIFYEFDGTACTSAVVRQSNGEIVFGSNLDFSFSTELSQLVYQQDVYRGATFLYRANAVYMQIGVLRGSQPGKFTISLNQRSGHKNSFRNLFFKEGFEAVYFTRYVLENANSFESAVALVKKENTLARAYYTIGG